MSIFFLVLAGGLSDSFVSLNPSNPLQLRRINDRFGMQPIHKHTLSLLVSLRHCSAAHTILQTQSDKPIKNIPSTAMKAAADNSARVKGVRWLARRELKRQRVKRGRFSGRLSELSGVSTAPSMTTATRTHGCWTKR